MKRTIITIMAAAVCLCASANVSASDSTAEIAAVSFRAKKDVRTVVFSAHLHCKNCVNALATLYEVSGNFMLFSLITLYGKVESLNPSI